VDNDVKNGDDVSLSDRSAHSGGSVINDNFFFIDEPFGSGESLGIFADIGESPLESDYSCFTTSQKCVTFLMYLLDEMECPDYRFQAIMEWPHQCF
jgi:hypothetical protein